MFAITKQDANRVDIELSGAIDADNMRAALDDLIAKSEGVENGRMLYTIPSVAWPTFGALAVEMARMPKLFGLLKQFDRCAVLSDAGWIKTAAEIEGALFPGLDIKAFSLSETDAAEAWLTEA